MALPPGIKLPNASRPGVPTPYTPHVHPYPTRYHGGIWTRPVFEFPYVQSPQAVFKPDDFVPEAYARYPWAKRDATAGLGDATALSVVWSLASLAGTVGGAYHGYRRTRSVGWALLYSLFGGVVPVIGIPVMMAQGFGKPKAMSPNRRRRKVARAKRRGRK